MRPFNSFEERNLRFLTQNSVECAFIQITETGYCKSILDATAPVRQYLLDCGLHDYESQKQGPEYKVKIETVILDDFSAYRTTTSLYRPRTKTGDPRIWPSGITKFCEADDILALICIDGRLYVVNISSVDIARVCSSSIATPLKSFVSICRSEALSVSAELTELLRDIAKKWHRAEVLADTGIGRTIESMLGIEMNSSKLPDYKGIELKSFRAERPNIRKCLFTQVPDWKLSRLHSAREIVEEYGYPVDGWLTYQNTVSCLAPNSQNLGLTLYQADEALAIEEKRKMARKPVFVKVADVALWRLPVLHQRLLSKHHETFWIEVETKIEHGRELFRPIMAEHTKNPIVSQFDNLLDAGYITVDILLARPSGNGDTFSFKMKKEAAGLLFPDSEQISLR